ncbi:CcmD family protein [Pedobacter flavus]|uniref:CcmD family protein n=1 Tax=Pedobacter flavus TaxID=3113906 RepID=A0ABU7H3T9_9SPHI|nr:CcmD family protein [Pedobacter sp. VNH31]MEE1885971.1 CcmD family protein [Pedobacter sp. VNH31]
MKKLLSFIYLMLVTLSFAKAESNVEMADGLYSSGKIYVVVGCLVIIVLGVFAYLFNLDKRLKKVENNFEKKK